jgi:hypothetical protein
MAIFKNDDDYEDTEEFEEEGGRELERFSRKIKDLRPANKRKRKEPPKPWGKKERLVVLSILALTVLISVMLTLTNGKGVNFKLKIPRIDLSSLNIFKEETIIIQKN